MVRTLARACGVHSGTWECMVSACGVNAECKWNMGSVQGGEHVESLFYIGECMEST